MLKHVVKDYTTLSQVNWDAFKNYADEINIRRFCLLKNKEVPNLKKMAMKVKDSITSDYVRRSAKCSRLFKKSEESSYRTDKERFSNKVLERIEETAKAIKRDLVKNNEISPEHLLVALKAHAGSTDPVPYSENITIRNKELRRIFTALPRGIQLVAVPYSLVRSLLKKRGIWGYECLNDITHIKETISVIAYLFSILNFIHPFKDYNGRSTRTVSNTYLISFGILPPLYVLPYEKSIDKINRERSLYNTKIGLLHEWFDQNVRGVLVKNFFDYRKGTWVMNKELVEAFYELTMEKPPEEMYEFIRYFGACILKHYYITLNNHLKP